MNAVFRLSVTARSLKCDRCVSVCVYTIITLCVKCLSFNGAFSVVLPSAEPVSLLNYIDSHTHGRASARARQQATATYFTLHRASTVCMAFALDTEEADYGALCATLRVQAVPARFAAYNSCEPNELAAPPVFSLLYTRRASDVCVCVRVLIGNLFGFVVRFLCDFLRRAIVCALAGRMKLN